MVACIHRNIIIIIKFCIFFLNGLQCQTSDSGYTDSVSPFTTIVFPSATTVSPSNTTVSPSNTSVSPSNTSVSPSNTTVFPSNTSVSPSNTTVSTSNTTVSTSNTTVSTSNTTASPSTTAVSTLTTQTLTTQPSGIRCYDGYCQNGGTCRISPCRFNNTICCACTADYTGDKCDRLRQQTYTLVIISALTYSSDLADTTSSNYNKYRLLFLDVVYRTMNVFYSQQSVTFDADVIRFVSGSIVTYISFKTTGTGASTLNDQTFTTTLQKVCGSNTSVSLCQSLAINTTSAFASRASDLCKSPLTNMCSQYSTCMPYNDTSYTCTCSMYFRDDSSSNQRPGTNCTETCSSSLRYPPCHSGGCTEVGGSTIQCTCPFQRNGNNCQYVSIGIIAITIAIFVILFIFILVMFCCLWCCTNTSLKYRGYG